MRFGRYVKECYSELKKVIWPKKNEVAYYIRVVLVMTLLSSVLLGVIDFLAMWGISFLF